MGALGKLAISLQVRAVDGWGSVWMFTIYIYIYIFTLYFLWNGVLITNIQSKFLKTAIKI